MKNRTRRIMNLRNIFPDQDLVHSFWNLLCPVHTPLQLGTLWMAGGRVAHTRHMCSGMIFEFLFEGKFTHIIRVGATSSSTSKRI